MKFAPKRKRHVNNNDRIFSIETKFGKIFSKIQYDGSYTIYFEKISSQDGFYEETWNQVKEEHLPFIKKLINKQKKNSNLQNISGFRFQHDLTESYFSYVDYEREFFLKAIDPHIWLFYSKIHRASAEQIYIAFMKNMNQETDESMILGQYYLLMGFSIENLLKAILIAQRFFNIKESFEKSHDYKDAESFLNKNLKKYTHNLKDIANEVKVGTLLTKEELDFLKRLERSIIYFNKYPVPWEINVYEEHKNYTPYQYKESKAIIDSLYNKLFLEYEKSLKHIEKDLSQLKSEAWECAYKS